MAVEVVEVRVPPGGGEDGAAALSASLSKLAEALQAPLIAAAHAMRASLGDAMRAALKAAR